MINIYTNKKYVPQNLKYVHDNEHYFVSIKLEDTLENRNIIKTIDKAEYSSCDKFIDRLGSSVYIKYLSTSSKILLNIVNSSQVYIFNCIELGSNAFEYLLCNIENCNILFPNGIIYDIPEYVDFNTLTFNGKIVESLDDVED